MRLYTKSRAVETTDEFLVLTEEEHAKLTGVFREALQRRGWSVEKVMREELEQATFTSKNGYGVALGVKVEE